MGIGIPIQMTVRKNPHHLQITRTWFEKKYLFLIPFVLAWDAFLFLLCKLTFSAPKADVFVILFLSLFLLVGVGTNYFMLADCLNTTTINVTSNVILIKHSPIPVWGNKRISSKELLQLECKKTSVRHGFYWVDAFSVLAKKKDQETITLLFGLRKVEQALFIKQEVEHFLDIV